MIHTWGIVLTHLSEILVVFSDAVALFHGVPARLLQFSAISITK